MTLEVLRPGQGGEQRREVIDASVQKDLEFLRHGSPSPGEVDILPYFVAAVREIKGVLCKIPHLRRLE